ncbi:MAG: hypothetical protein AAFY07_00755 [Pseudomonadota bacterium]
MPILPEMSLDGASSSAVKPARAGGDGELGRPGLIAEQAPEFSDVLAGSQADLEQHLDEKRGGGGESATALDAGFEAGRETSPRTELLPADASVSAGLAIAPDTIGATGPAMARSTQIRAGERAGRGSERNAASHSATDRSGNRLGPVAGKTAPPGGKPVPVIEIWDRPPPGSEKGGSDKSPTAPAKATRGPAPLEGSGLRGGEMGAASQAMAAAQMAKTAPEMGSQAGPKAAAATDRRSARADPLLAGPLSGSLSSPLSGPLGGLRAPSQIAGSVSGGFPARIAPQSERAPEGASGRASGGWGQAILKPAAMAEIAAQRLGSSDLPGAQTARGLMSGSVLGAPSGAAPAAPALAGDAALTPAPVPGPAPTPASSSSPASGPSSASLAIASDPASGAAPSPAHTSANASAHATTAPTTPLATPLATPPAAPPAAPASASGSVLGEARLGAQMESAIESLAQTREAGRDARPELNLRHGEFGAVKVQLAVAGGDVRATLSARDPGFVPAMHAALAERGIVAGTEAASTHTSRGQDQSSAQSHTSQQQSGHQSGQQSGQSSGGRYGLSPGGDQGSSQPYSEQSGNRDEEDRSRGPQAAAPDGVDADTMRVRRGGLFA